MEKREHKNTEAMELDKNNPLDILRKEDIEEVKEKGGVKGKEDKVEDRSEGNKGRIEGYSYKIEGSIKGGKEGKRNSEVTDNKGCYWAGEEEKKTDKNGEDTMEE